MQKCAEAHISPNKESEQPIKETQQFQSLQKPSSVGRMMLNKTPLMGSKIKRRSNSET